MALPHRLPASGGLEGNVIVSYFNLLRYNVAKAFIAMDAKTRTTGPACIESLASAKMNWIFSENGNGV